MKIDNISFGRIPFRMFKDVSFNISDRITIIAGHNGIGKSTLLGLIANGSELKKKDCTTLFNKAFQAQLHELFYLDKTNDFIADRNKKPFFQLIYSDENKEKLVKTCKVSLHKQQKGKLFIERLKVVPRGSQEGWTVGNSAKVPIPTLFLSMSRMVPVGEYNESLNTSIISRMHQEDKEYIKKSFESIISHNISKDNSITKHELKGSTKRSLLPNFTHSSRTISLGQDSLSSIITAFASFHKIKRELREQYKGGLLLIDEIDAGFHPFAQKKLMNYIIKEAKHLDLQIVATTHSLTIIKKVLEEENKTNKYGKNINSVIYIEDEYKPKIRTNLTYKQIKQDMLSILPEKKIFKNLKIYFEDEEAKWFFEELIKYSKTNLLGDNTIYNIKLIASKIGCDNLKSLIEVDDYFKTVLIIFDNDICSKKANIQFISKFSNLLYLPAIVDKENTSPENRTPEAQIYTYLLDLSLNPEHKIWDDIPSGYNIGKIKDSILDQYKIMIKDKTKKERESRKKWFVDNKIHFERIQLMKYFYADYQQTNDIFIDKCKNKIYNLIK